MALESIPYAGAGDSPGWFGAGGAVTNPAAYGSVPVIPETSQDVTRQISTPQFPQYPTLSEQASRVAGRQMEGTFDPEDIIQMRRQAAEMGIQTGAPGSANAAARYLASYLLGREKLRETGVQSYFNILAQSPRTTTQAAQRSNAVLAAMYRAAPQPYAAAMANLGATSQGLAGGRGSIALPSGGGGMRRPVSDPMADALAWQQSLADQYTAQRLSQPGYTGAPYVASAQPMYGGYDTYPSWVEEVTGEPYTGYTYMGAAQPSPYAQTFYPTAEEGAWEGDVFYPRAEEGVWEGETFYPVATEGVYE